MEEEAKCRYGDVFTLAEREFFKHRLVTLYLRSRYGNLHHLSRTTEISQLPKFVHTEQRGFGCLAGLSSGDNLTRYPVSVMTYQKLKMM